MVIDPSNRGQPRDSPKDPPESGRHLAFLRAIIWGLIGLIYAPLFVGLAAMFDLLGAGLLTYIAAAALAGGAGSALYAGREVALLGTGVGVGVGVTSLLLWPHLGSFQHAAVIAGVVAAAIVLLPGFPVRCDRRVPVRVLVGVVTGALCGAVLGMAEPLHPEPFSTFALLAFLVSVNGILYVASVGRVLSAVRGVSVRWLPCSWVEALVAGSLAALAAGSVWVMAGPFLGDQGTFLQGISEAIYRQLPMALLGGTFGGALAGALLGAFRFPWVYET